MAAIKTFQDVKDGETIYILNPHTAQIQEATIKAVSTPTLMLDYKDITYYIPHHQLDLVQEENRPTRSIRVPKASALVLVAQGVLPVPIASDKAYLQSWMGIKG